MYRDAKLAALKENNKLKEVTNALGKSSMSGVPAPGAGTPNPALAARIRGAPPPAAGAGAPPPAAGAGAPGGAFVMAPASFAVPQPQPPHDPAMDALVASVASTTLANKKAGIEGWGGEEGGRRRRHTRRRRGKQIKRRKTQRKPKRKRA